MLHEYIIAWTSRITKKRKKKKKKKEKNLILQGFKLYKNSDEQMMLK